MNQQELNDKLDLIEEQANMTLAEYPKTLTKERLRLIVSLVRYIRSELQASGLPSRSQNENDDGLQRASIKS